MRAADVRPGRCDSNPLCDTGDIDPMNSFGSKSTLTSNGKTYEIYRLNTLEQKGVTLAKLP